MERSGMCVTFHYNLVPIAGAMGSIGAPIAIR